MEFKKYLEIIIRRKFLLVIIFSTVFLVPLITSCFLTKIYRASARVSITIQDIQSEYVSGLPRDLGKYNYVEAKNAIDTYTHLFKDPISLNKLIKKLNLRDSRGNLLKAKDLTYTFISFINKQKRAIQIKQISSAEIFEIRGYSHNPQESVEIANSIVEVFLNLYAEIYHQKTKKALEVMETLFLEVSEDLSKAEETQKELMIKEDLVDHSEQSKSLISQVSNLENTYYQTIRTLQERDSELSSIENELKKIPKVYKSSITFEANPVIQSYKNQLLEYETSLAKSLVERTPEHLEVQMIQKQIDTVKNIIKRESFKSFSSQTKTRNSRYSDLLDKYSDSEIEIASLRIRENVLSDQIKMKRKELLEIPSKRFALKEIEREVSILESSCSSLKEGVALAKIASKLDISNACVISYADIQYVDTQHPYFPNKMKTAVFAVGLGMLLSIFVVFFLEYIDNTLKADINAETILGVPVLARIPRIPEVETLIKEQSGTLTGHKGNYFWNAFLNLKSSIQLTLSGDIPKVVVVTSTNKSDGKSIVSFFFARIMAESGKRVLFVDCNLHRPFLINHFTLNSAKGLTSLLTKDHIGKEELQEHIHQTTLKNINLIHTSRHLVPLQLIDLSKLEAFTSLLRKMEEYDIVILDTSPAIDGNEAFFFSQFTDKVIIVAHEGKTDIDDTAKTIRILNKDQQKVLGIVLNSRRRWQLI